MRLHLKVIAAAFAAALVVSTMPAPASANQQQQQQQRVGLWPFLAGPIGAAAIAGPTTSVWHQTLTKKLFFPKYSSKGWYKVGKLYKAGYNLKIKKIYIPSKGKYVKVKAKKTVKHSSKGINGKVVVGCIMGSAFGAITASMRKMTAMGNPPRWRSQAEHEKIVASGYEKQFELTNDEAMTAIAFCGLGSFALNWQQAPVLQTKY